MKKFEARDPERRVKRILLAGRSRPVVALVDQASEGMQGEAA